MNSPSAAAPGSGPSQVAPSSSAMVWRLVAVVFLLAGCARIVSTYTLFSHTFDETHRLATGLEWWAEGRYTRELTHPPLAGIAAAALPYLAGARPLGFEDSWTEGAEILLRGGYARTLALSRAGLLPFFLLALYAVWALARDLFGYPAAAMAVGAFSFLPPILAQAGLNGNDFPVAAALAWMAHRLLRLFDSPTLRNRILFALAVGVALVTKLSALLFTGAFVVVALVTYVVLHRTAPPGFRDWRSALRSLALMTATALVVIATPYRFTVEPTFRPLDRPHGLLDRLLADKPAWRNFAYRVVETPVPLGGFLHGFGSVAAHSAAGHATFFLGRRIQFGDWRFFPVVLSVKTPLAFLILAGVGFVLASRSRSAPALAVALGSLIWLLVMLPSRLTLGLRYLLPVYPLLAVLAGSALIWLWQGNWKPIWSRALAFTLSCWLFAASVLAHPDYLAYFNELAGRHPERIVIGSDLDSGQDWSRLLRHLEQLGVQEAWYAPYGTVPIERLTNIRMIVDDGLQPRRGWYALSISAKIGLQAFARQHGLPEPFHWLDSRPVHSVVGRTILVYHLQ